MKTLEQCKQHSPIYVGTFGGRLSNYRCQSCGQGYYKEMSAEELLDLRIEYYRNKKVELDKALKKEESND